MEQKFYLDLNFFLKIFLFNFFKNFLEADFFFNLFLEVLEIDFFFLIFFFSGGFFLTFFFIFLIFFSFLTGSGITISFSKLSSISFISFSILSIFLTLSSASKTFPHSVHLNPCSIASSLFILIHLSGQIKKLPSLSLSNNLFKFSIFLFFKFIISSLAL